MAASFTTAVRQDSNDCLSFSSNGDDCQRPVTATAAAPVCMDSVASPACEESLTENHNHQQNEEDNTLETHDGTKVEHRKSCTIRCNQCNGDVGLEVAVEAHPDLIFESDLVSSSHSSREFEHITNGYGQPRVYLERESFTSHEDIQASSSVSVSAEDTLSPMDILDGSDSATWKNQKKHFFVLSEAGKPIYTRYGNEEQLVTLFGVMQALVSVVEDSQDSLETIVAGDTKFVFLHKSPLILVAVSKLRDSPNQLQLQLHYLYNQILSVITETQLERIFEQRRNYDLRRLLAGSERLMDSILNYMDHDYSVLLGAIKCLPMPLHDRDTVTQTIMQQCSKIKNLLFAVLVGNSQLISLVRMKKHILQPGDVHLIVNLVSSSETFKTAEGWTPICLPHYDPSGFNYAHASYLSDDCQACLLFFTSDRDSFFTLSEAKKKIVERLRRHNTLECITTALNQKGVSPQQLGLAPEIRHFLYKSRLNNQFVSSSDLVPPYQQPEHGAPYLMELYRYILGRMHLPSRPLKVLCHTAEKELLFGWVTSGWEVYMIVEPMATKAAVSNAASTLLKWVKKEEDRYFIVNSATW